MQTQVNFPDKGFDMDILLLDSNNEVESYQRGGTEGVQTESMPGCKAS